MRTAKVAFAVVEREVGKRARYNQFAGLAPDLCLHPLSADRLAALTQTI